MPTAERTQADIERVRRRDQEYAPNQAMLAERMRAVVLAQRAMRDREAGAVYAFRGALVDLAAIAEELAGDFRRRG